MISKKWFEISSDFSKLRVWLKSRFPVQCVAWAHEHNCVPLYTWKGKGEKLSALVRTRETLCNGASGYRVPGSDLTSLIMIQVELGILVTRSPEARGSLNWLSLLEAVEHLGCSPTYRLLVAQVTKKPRVVALATFWDVGYGHLFNTSGRFPSWKPR